MQVTRLAPDLVALADVAPLRLIPLPGGEFLMGSPESEKHRDDDERQHLARVGPFAIGEHEVTLAQWAAVMGDRPNDCDFGCEDNHPVQRVSWNDACRFTIKLTEHENAAREAQGLPPLTPCYVADGDTWVWPEGQRGCTGYRLPTEAEWEYAARAGSTTAYSFGDDPADLCRYANVADESAKKEHPKWKITPCDDGYAELAPVGKFKANGWGLFDMHGNVYEWVWDRYGEYPSEAVDNDKGGAGGDDKDDKSVKSGPYTGPESGEYRVLRGGSFGLKPRWVRAAVRVRNRPTDLNLLNGFRVLRVSLEP